jgi:S-adenosylmethionine:tRNA ribosyltransferase-isomerase
LVTSRPLRTDLFDYHLPPERIAQHPSPEREQSRLLVLNRAAGTLQHQIFHDLPEFVRSGDVIALNNSKVFPARLRGQNPKTGGKFEILLLEENSPGDWWALVRPGKRAPVGGSITILDATHCPTAIRAAVIEVNSEGQRRLRFEGTSDVTEMAAAFGEIPLPPYITRSERPSPSDEERYQTVFAQSAGSVAAPTAGLHFTEALLDRLRAKGARICFVTLHVGLGTFAPVKADTVEEHVMHEERYQLTAETASAINDAKLKGNRVIAVGTTSVRVLESAAELHPGALQPHSGRTRIFIHPPRKFAVVDALLTNFHLPRSTLLMLVSAFAAPGETRGREMILAAYTEAIRERYRFFSYGDAMFLV